MSQLSPPASPPFVILMLPDAQQQLDAYIRFCRTEISGFGTVDTIDGQLVITAIHLLDQEVSAVDTILSVESVARFTSEAVAAGVDVGKIRLWWHSHAKIGAYFSPTDEETIETFNAAPWMLSYVGNHNGDYQARMDIYPTPGLPMRYTLPVKLQTVFDAELVRRTRAEIARKVHEPAPEVGYATGTPGPRKVGGKKSPPRKEAPTSAVKAAS